jgi:hypothetical protein
VSKSDNALVNDARDVLKRKLIDSFGEAMPAVIKAIDTDIRKVDRLVELLEQFRNDLFYIGVKNLVRSGECIPDHTGNVDDYSVAFWDFNDKFRHRFYRLKYDFNEKAYSAWGVQMHETIPVGIAAVPVTEEMLADLRSKLKPEHVERIHRMQSAWDVRKAGRTSELESGTALVQRS